ncbi:hypothetical protein HZS_7496, partial [Henneguya salminicola]
MPGLLCKTNENYQSSQNEWWSCCWIKDNEFQEFLAYSGLDENIIISKLEHGDLKEVDKITVPQSQAISHINKHHFKPCVLWSSFFTPSDNHLCVPSNNHENGGISVTDIEKNQESVDNKLVACCSPEGVIEAWDVSYNHDASLFASVGEFGDVCVFA